METALFVVILVIFTALVFDFTNGFHDSANAMATSVATGALKPKVAVAIAAVLNVAGAFLSTEVAKTISGGIVNDVLVTPTMVFAGLVGAILWNLVTWLVGLPSSSSHALFGGLIGAVIIGAGTSAVNFSTVISEDPAARRGRSVHRRRAPPPSAPTWLTNSPRVPAASDRPTGSSTARPCRRRWWRWPTAPPTGRRRWA